MGLQDTPNGERIHIGIFGRVNSGKSSVINAITGQGVSIVSEVRGTTTDPVKKAMELLPLGPVVFMDTPGLDDDSILGRQRVERTLRILEQCDIALVVMEADLGITEDDRKIIVKIREKNIPYILVFNKSDLIAGRLKPTGNLNADDHEIFVSALNLENIHELKEMMGKLVHQEKREKKLVSDLISPKDVVILVVPIDSAAPKGRLILPQQQVVRDVLDHGGKAIIVQVEELREAIDMLRIKPKLVVTDSQAFSEVKDIVPEDIPLTSFSILMARYKGDLEEALRGAYELERLKDGQRVL
ncbi:MAG TPA: [FeFe] hydrogenase H-cluster maturation GTPase HydF, partial [Bacteroidales bacterium]|nr:[FeFe] hydrogenase H-cluster maturation GTPase HydF [Bacteroidales bacterium]